jgi:hypothetical protein
LRSLQRKQPGKEVATTFNLANQKNIGTFILSMFITTQMKRKSCIGCYNEEVA